MVSSHSDSKLHHNQRIDLRSGTKRCALIITEPFDPHADAVIQRLNERDFAVVRWHPEEFPQRSWASIHVTADGRLEGEIGNAHRSCRVDEISGAWYRRPGIPGVTDAPTPSLRRYISRNCRSTLSAFWHCIAPDRWIASPQALAVAELKPLQLAAAVRAGFQIPETLFSNAPSHVRQFRRDIEENGKCAVKAHDGETVADKICFRVPLTSVWHDDVDVTDGAIASAPSIYQRYIPKATEVRCVVIGPDVFAAEVDTQWFDDACVDGRAWPDSPHRPHQVSPALRQAALTLVNGFGIKFASMDLILTPEGDYVFLDLNPNGQWLWLEQRMGIPLIDSMAKLLSDGAQATDGRLA